MKLIAGLGNPGKEYEKTRHNSGYMALARLADDLGVTVTTNKFQALTASAVINGEKVILMEPLTFMNLSGNAVRACADYYHIEPEDILVIHDDMDLPVGSVRIRTKGSSGGQKGMKHIISCMGTDEIVPDWVLSPVSKDDREAFDHSIEVAAAAAKAWVSEPINQVMSKYNLKVKQEKEI